MRSFQIIVVFVLMASMVMSTTAIAQPDEARALPVEALALIDAAGKTLGPALDVNGPFFKVPHVPFTVGNSVFMLAVFKSKFGGSGIPNNLYFSDRRCDSKTGQAAAAASEISTIDDSFWSFVGADGGTVYVPTSNAQPIQSFKAISRLTAEPNGSVVCVESPIFIPTAIPATPLVNMLNLFTPPFAVKAVTKQGMRPIE